MARWCSNIRILDVGKVSLIKNKEELTAALQWPLLYTEGILLQHYREKKLKRWIQGARLLVCRDAVTVNQEYQRILSQRSCRTILTNIHEEDLSRQ